MAGHPGMQVSGGELCLHPGWRHFLDMLVPWPCWNASPWFFGAGSVLPTEFLPGILAKYIK